jgi:hypothetical protein
MKDEETIDWREGFSKFPLNKEDKFKEGSWRLTKGRGEYLAFWEEKGGE